MRVLRKSLALACLFLCGSAQSVETPTLRPGEYITKGGEGNLVIHPKSHGGQKFSLLAIGRNRHRCTLEGTIVNGESQFEHGHFWEWPGKPEEACVVRFRSATGEIEVSTPDLWQCSGYCGKNMSFEGKYSAPAKGCDSQSLRRSLDNFKHTYDVHAFSDAYAIISDTLAACRPTMDWITLDKTLNDKAITEYKLGMFDECLRTLEPLKADAAKPWYDLRNELPPVDFDEYYPITRAAEFNLKLCAERGKGAASAP